MKTMKKILPYLCCICITALLVFSLTHFVIDAGQKTPAASDAPTQTVPQETAEPYVAKLEEISRYLSHYFIGELPDDQTVSDALAAALVSASCDEWSYYISAKDYDSYMESVQNAYVGIGVTISTADDNPLGIEVVGVAHGGPAEKAGIQIGDVMTKVEGQSTKELGLQETKNRVRGKEGTSVSLTFSRDGMETEYQIVRESIKVENITYEMMDNQIGYLAISNFETNCAADTISAIEDLVQQGAKGIVFDLRFNPGGMKDELVKILDYLLPEGILFQSVNYKGEKSVDYSDASYLDLPMAVLVNVDSYSAAEFFAAALQEYGAGTVVGTQTYGKGYYQNSFVLSDGSVLGLSTGKYCTPKGVSLAGVGITPDVVVEVDDETYRQLALGTVDKADDVQLQAAIDAILR